ncbi:MAG: carbohydrate ABC transporter permease [Acetobacteraceae bacterium]
MSARRIAASLLSHAVLAAGAVVMVLPFWWMLLTALRPPDEVFTGGIALFPQRFHGVENFSQALASAPFLRFMLNGVIVCAGILVVQLVVAIPAAYALAKLPFTGRRALFAAVVGAIAIPIQVPALPLYLAFAELGLLNGYFALMAPFFLSVFAIFLLRQVFRQYPDEIIQAARLDGASEFEIVWRFVVPAALPAIAAFSIFSIVAHWNDLYWPLIVITETRLAPPPLGMLFFRDAETGSNYGALMAGATMITAPLVLAFLVARRRFIQGITMTGLK